MFQDKILMLLKQELDVIRTFLLKDAVESLVVVNLMQDFKGQCCAIR